MQITSFNRTALFKSEGRGVLLLKLSLPRVNSETDNEIFRDSFNDFYLQLCDNYISVCADLVEDKGSYIRENYERALICSISWSLSEKTGVYKKSKSDNGKLIISRYHKLCFAENIMLRENFVDVFDMQYGFILK